MRRSIAFPRIGALGLTATGFLAVLLGFFTLPALADQWVHKKQQQLVYKLRVFDGVGYSGGFVPQSESIIYLLAESNNLLSVRETLVYFWPFTWRWRADWRSLDRPVDGDLEVIRGKKLIQRLKKKVNVQYYPKKEEKGALLYTEDKALSAYRKYQKAGMEYTQQQKRYFEDYQKYQEETKEFLEKVARGKVAYTRKEIEQMMPRRPKRPQPPGFFVTTPSEDYIVNLPQGRYRIRIRAEDGTVVKESEKSLVVFDARRKKGVGYEIVFGDNWIKRRSCDRASEIIYAYEKNTLYFRPFLQNEYNHLYYNKLKNSQNAGNVDRYKWVHIQPIQDVLLVLSSSRGEVLEKVDTVLYSVDKVSDREPGYCIVEFKEEGFSQRMPRFEGYKVVISPQRSDADYTISLERKKDGEHVPGSDRKIRLVQKKNPWFFYLFSLFPVAVGLTVSLCKKLVLVVIK